MIEEPVERRDTDTESPSLEEPQSVASNKEQQREDGLEESSQTHPEVQEKLAEELPAESEEPEAPNSPILHGSYYVQIEDVQHEASSIKIDDESTVATEYTRQQASKMQQLEPYSCSDFMSHLSLVSSDTFSQMFCSTKPALHNNEPTDDAFVPRLPAP